MIIYIVIIENKLDDSKRDTTWQALKYASYCSSLTPTQVRDIFQQYLNKEGSEDQAENIFEEFFGTEDYFEHLNKGTTQRVIMVAGEFRKEVTSTVLWLMTYGLRIQCFKVTPFKYNEQLLLNFEQIIPVKDTEEYVISIANKTKESISSQEELKSRHLIRIEFWKKLLAEAKKYNGLFENISPSKDYWISEGCGIGGITFTFVISKINARVELYIGRASQEENKIIFDKLVKHKEEIERAFSSDLTWERLDDKKASRIKHQLDNVSIFNHDDWNKIIKFMIDSMIKLRIALKPYLKADLLK